MDNIKTGDVVLCKVGSYPAWPAIVFPQQFLRREVLRKMKANTIAVCFFNEHTYYWAKRERLQPLTAKMIRQFLKEKAENNALAQVRNAYEEASKYTSLHDFVVNRLTDEGRLKELGNQKVMSGENVNESTSATRNGKGTPSKVQKVSTTIRRRQNTQAGSIDTTATKRRKVRVIKEDDSRKQHTRKRQKVEKSPLTLPVSETVEESIPLKRKPERPRKHKTVASTVETINTRRKPGRLKKSKTASENVTRDATTTKRGPGRPKKHTPLSQESPENITLSKRKPGRPRKYPVMKKEPKKWYIDIPSKDKMEISIIFRKQLQRSLLQRNNAPSPTDILESAKVLEKMQQIGKEDEMFFTNETLSKSKLPNLLYAIQESTQLADLHNISQGLLTKFEAIQKNTK